MGQVSDYTSVTDDPSKLNIANKPKASRKFINKTNEKLNNFSGKMFLLHSHIYQAK